MHIVNGYFMAKVPLGYVILRSDMKWKDLKHRYFFMQYDSNGLVNAIDKDGHTIGKVESVHESSLQKDLFKDGIDNLIIPSGDDYRFGYESIVNKKLWYDDNLFLACYAIKNGLSFKEYLQFIYHKFITGFYSKSF